jgi:hypothetical protein
MLTPNRWTVVIGVGLVFAVPSLVGLLIWATHRDQPNWSYPVFGTIYGLPLAVVAIYLWLRALKNAPNEARELRLMIMAGVFVAATLTTTFLLAQ